MKRVEIVLSLMAAVLFLAGCHNSIEAEEERTKVSSNTEFVTTEAESPVSSLEGDEIESSAISEQQTESGKPKPKPNPGSSAGTSTTISVVSSTSAAPSRPKPPTVSSAPSKPPAPASSAPPAAESSAPQKPEDPEPEPPEEKDPYAYPFDIEAIRQDLIEYGESLGMKHRTHYSDGTEVTPDNGSWELPLYIKKGFPSNIMQRRLHEQLDSYHNIYKAEAFTIYIESCGNSEYQIYSIYA